MPEGAGVQVIGVDPSAEMRWERRVRSLRATLLHFHDAIDRAADVPTSGVRSRPAGLYDPVGGEREGDPVTPEQPLRGNVILIVEDDAETLTALAQLIADGLGCRVLTALSGYEALDVIDSGVQVDLVFVDVVMPEMDGMTLAFLIGRRLASLPVVLATGRSDVVDSVTERGGIALLKPYSLERLEAVFTEQLGLQSVVQPGRPQSRSPNR